MMLFSIKAQIPKSDFLNGFVETVSVWLARLSSPLLKELGAASEWRAPRARAIRAKAQPNFMLQCDVERRCDNAKRGLKRAEGC